ncbi:hypothetical protein L332_01765 [Agrococcus pavilionensis RW1]|uniref:Uncharacterized protein n=1 Tax=Agrococcus pavilionensis RW1 TaxID=1330458 RepID=U1LMK7_9MICO|nr:hypothetical protein L332_01765 [Agrococcus pavilionensis RW1]
MDAWPVIRGLIEAFDTPERRVQLRRWLARADAAIRKLTPEGRISARIAVLRAHLDRLDADAANGQVWNERLSKLEAKRALLKGPLDARTRRAHNRKLAEDLESLWAEVFAAI